MDIGSFTGLLTGLILVIGAIAFGGSFQSFIHIPGLMIVVGGTLGATMINYQLSDVMTAFKAAWLVFQDSKTDPNEIVASMNNICLLSRKSGLLALGDIQTDHQLLKKACELMADGTPEEELRKSLNIEIESLQLRHMNIQDVFRKMGTYAPAFGMIGTLIGMVQMLQELSSPDKIGPAMATALLTTFYGSFFSSLIFIPIAGKLKNRTMNEMIILNIIFEGAISIVENNNPLSMYEKISSFIPAKQRQGMKSFVHTDSLEGSDNG